MYKIDKTDLAIINLLMEDGRMACADIARRIGHLTERSARYRLERMLAEGILRIGAVADPLKLGFTVIADVFIEVEPGLIMEVAQQLVRHPKVRYVACSTGERDVSIQVIARSNAEVFTLVTEEIARLPGVRKTTTSIVPLTLKDVYDWRIPEGACPPDEAGESTPRDERLEKR